MFIDFVVWPLTRALLLSSHPTWVIKQVHKSNLNQFDYILREFAESPQVVSYMASKKGQLMWHSGIWEGHCPRNASLLWCCCEAKPTRMKVAI
jgi:hypothetical protein